MYKKCNVPFKMNSTAIPSDIIVAYNKKTISHTEKTMPKEEIAAFVFQQMLDYKKEMLKDLDHRRKCLA